MPSGQAANRDCCRERRKCGRQARGPLRGKMHLESDSRSPVIKDGFFKPRGTPEFRRDPVAGLDHGACDPCVARFVGTDQADGAKVREQRDQNYQRGCDERCDVRVALRFCRFAQSAMSLTSSLPIWIREARRALGTTDDQGQSRLIIVMNVSNAQSSNDSWHTLRRLLHNGPLCGNGWNMRSRGRD